MSYNKEKLKKEDGHLLYKTLQFKNKAGRMVKIMEIPVLEEDNHAYFMVQARLQALHSSLSNERQGSTCYSFREHLKQKLRWPDYKALFQIEDFKNNA